MKYNIFGKTDFKVSDIGFGAWAIGGQPGAAAEMMRMQKRR